MAPGSPVSLLLSVLSRFPAASFPGAVNKGEGLNEDQSHLIFRSLPTSADTFSNPTFVLSGQKNTANGKLSP